MPTNAYRFNKVGWVKYRFIMDELEMVNYRNSLSLINITLSGYHKCRKIIPTNIIMS